MELYSHHEVACKPPLLFLERGRSLSYFLSSEWENKNVLLTVWTPSQQNVTKCCGHEGSVERAFLPLASAWKGWLHVKSVGLCSIAHRVLCQHSLRTVKLWDKKKGATRWLWKSSFSRYEEPSNSIFLGRCGPPCFLKALNQGSKVLWAVSPFIFVRDNLKGSPGNKFLVGALTGLQLSVVMTEL